MNSINSCNHTNYNLSFSAMKPNQFKNIDYACVRKFKAPVEKFNNINDFKEWAIKKFNEICSKDLKGKNDETIFQRTMITEEWKTFLLNLGSASTALIAILSLLKNIKNNNDNLPPIFCKESFDKTLDAIKIELDQNKEYQFNFSSIYKTFLRSHLLGKNITNGWIVIPSKTNSPNQFFNNVTLLKLLSNKTWCTKAYMAESHLQNGDFHIFVKNGDAKLCLRFVGDEVLEIQNERNDSKIDFKTFHEVKKYINENNLKLSGKAKIHFDEAEKRYKNFEEIYTQLNKAIKDNDTEKIYTYLGFEPERDENGNLSIREYKQPSEDTSFSDLGINEDKLLEQTNIIRGNAFFSNSKATSLKNIKSIWGDLELCNSNVSSIGELEYVLGDANFNNSEVMTTDKLKEIKGNAYFDKSSITNLLNIEKIGGSVYLNSYITSLGKLQYIGRNVNFNSNNLELGNLEYIGGDVIIGKGIHSLGNLKIINGDLDIADSKLSELGELECVRGMIYISKNSNIDKELLNNIAYNQIIEVEDFEL